MVSSHVDDFKKAGTKEFLEEITKKIVQKLEISKLEDNEVRFTGIDVAMLMNVDGNGNVDGNVDGNV